MRPSTMGSGRSPLGEQLLLPLGRGEAVEGDQRALKLRPPSFYRKLFSSAGLTGVGCHGWLGPELADLPAALERR